MASRQVIRLLPRAEFEPTNNCSGRDLRDSNIPHRFAGGYCSARGAAQGVIFATLLTRARRLDPNTVRAPQRRRRILPRPRRRPGHLTITRSPSIDCRVPVLVAFQSESISTHLRLEGEGTTRKFNLQAITVTPSVPDV